jgi:hypothetical protein
MPDDVLAAIALLGGDGRLLDQPRAALVPVAVVVEGAAALASVLRSGARVRLLILGERHAPIMLALLGALAGCTEGRVAIC